MERRFGPTVMHMGKKGGAAGRRRFMRHEGEWKSVEWVVNHDSDGTPEGDEQESEIVFEEPMYSPYLYSLGGEYDLQNKEQLLGSVVDGVCPICNNKYRAEIEMAMLSGASNAAIRQLSNATTNEITKHLKEHLAGMHTAVATEMGLINKDFNIEDKNIIAHARRAKQQEELKKAYPDETDDAPKSEMLFITDADALIDKVRKDAYAMEWGKEVRVLKPWTRARARVELERKLMETINFYDEMLDCRAKADRVYNEIMDNGDLKLYGIAISAIREKRGVVDTLGKMSLIAKTLSDQTEGQVRRVSPELASVMDALGVKMIAHETLDSVQESVPIEHGASDVTIEVLPNE